MAAVLILYQYFFIPHEPTPAGNASSTATSPSRAPAKPAPSPAPTAPATPVLPVPAAAAASRPPQRLARVSAPLYEAAVSSEGGKLQELTLKYRGEKPLIIIGELGRSGLVLASGRASAQGVPTDLAADHTTLSRERPSQDVVMSGAAEGLRVRQTLSFRADDYTIDARVRVENPSSTARTVTVALPWSTRQEWRETKERFQGQHPTELVWSSHGQVAREDGLCAITPVATDGEWIAMDSVWYMAALIP